MMNNPRSLPSRRVVATVAAAAMVFPSLLTWLYFVALQGHPAAVQQVVYTTGKILQFGLPLLWVLAVKGRIPRAASRRTWRLPYSIGVGAVFGLLVAAAILAGYYGWLQSSGWFTAAETAIGQKALAFGLRTPAQFAAVGIFYALVHSLLEEYYWRWFVFGQLRRLLPLGQSTALASLAFAAHHWIVLGSYFGRFSPVTWLMTFAVAVGGAVWCGIYHRSHSLLGPWLSHALVDAAIFAVGFAIIRHAAGG
jgi:membrane protease YdiL (CAAX protease family)